MRERLRCEPKEFIIVVKKGTLSVSLYEGAPSTTYTVWEFIEDVENLIVMRNEAFPSDYISGTSITTHHDSSNFYYTGEAAVNGNQPTTHKDSVCVTQVIGWK